MAGAHGNAPVCGAKNHRSSQSNHRGLSSQVRTQGDKQMLCHSERSPPWRAQRRIPAVLREKLPA
jgi:hypothetical protein